MFKDSYDQYATPRQKEYLQAMDTYGTQAESAKALGVHESTIRKGVQAVKAKAASKGFAPEHDMTETCPDGYQVKGTSTLYDKDGNKKIQWVKTNVDKERQYEMMQEAIGALVSDLPRVEPLSYKGSPSSSLMAVYPLGDPHIGVLCWAAETGQDWDLVIAEKAYLEMFDRLIMTAPACDHAVIVNLGDFFHTDNMEGTTTRSGHSLDVDGRYAKMVQVGMLIIRRMIETALTRHKTVRVINAIGNHDDTSSIFLAEALRNIYDNEPRVIIDRSTGPFHYIEFGKWVAGVHHGHTCKADKLPLLMATDVPDMWGRTFFRTWLTGHIHHDTLKEYNGCTVESFRTLAAKDSYAAWGGYRSLQDSKCLVIHEEYGEVERHTVSIRQLGLDN
jgi:hypothetical protein